MIKNDNEGIQRELEIEKGVGSCSSDELVNCYTHPLVNELWDNDIVSTLHVFIYVGNEY